MIPSFQHSDTEHKEVGPAWADEVLALADVAHASGKLSGWEDAPVMRQLASGRSLSILREASLFYFSSGTTGSPKVIAYGRDEWEDEVERRAWCLKGAGVDAGDRVAIALPFGPWFSGDNISQAIVRLGATVMPGGIYAPHQPALAHLFTHLDANVLITTPTLALALHAQGMRRRFEKLIFVGEAMSPRLASQLQKRFGAFPRMLFAASEGVIGHEDPAARGWYRWDADSVYLEVLSKANGNPTQEGTGELLLTLRRKKLQPVIRYAMGDMVEIRGERFRFLGRLGHAFALATGVKVARTQVEQFIHSLDLPVCRGGFNVHHGSDGRDMLTVELHVLSNISRSDKEREEMALADSLISFTPEIQDAARSGLLDVEVRLVASPVQQADKLRKCQLTFSESPWKL